MVPRPETTPDFQAPDFDYGNRPAIEVIRLTPYIGRTGLDPHASLDIEPAEPLFTDAALEDKVTEIADNYRIIGDPQSQENRPKKFGMTIANAHLHDEGVPGILVISTNGSSLYDEEGNPNNEGNALELAYTAFKYPDKPVYFIESPGTGSSTDLEDDEYKEAAKDGKLVHETRDGAGRITDYEAFETMQAMARALAHEGVAISHISSNATGAHFSTALMAALPRDSVERAFLYNPSNISDRNIIALTLGTFREILSQGKYSERSKDPLRLTDERKEMARKVMGSVAKRKLDLARGSTHNPVKMWRQQKIFRRGNGRGQSAAVHSVAGQLQHPGARQTFVFPEFASQYKRPEDFSEFMELVDRLGGRVVEMTDVESLKIPLGQYGHSHYPTARQTLESYGFKR